jgi:hypothetical protein
LTHALSPTDFFQEQLENDIEKAAVTLEEAKAGATKLRKELATLAQELSASEVCYLFYLIQLTAASLIFGLGLSCKSREEVTRRARHTYPLRQRAERARTRDQE